MQATKRIGKEIHHGFKTKGITRNFKKLSKASQNDFHILWGDHFLKINKFITLFTFCSISIPFPI